jgi:tetratricopeptide (TPR) repeat protein
MMDNLTQKFEKDTATIIRTLNGYTTVKNNIETRFTPYATCEDLVNIYGKKLEGNEENVELLIKVTRLMNRKKCIDNQVFFTATENLHRLQPTANSAFLMGYMLFKKEQFPQAKDYLEQAISKFEKQSDRAPAYIMLVEISSKMGQYSAARQYAYKYAEAVPTSGIPYLLIGDMYAATATSCGDNELTTRVAYWAAADKYNRAKQIDSSLEEEANQRISRVRSRFPDRNTIFFYGLQQGQSYTVGCWINETTTVR